MEESVNNMKRMMTALDNVRLGVGPSPPLIEDDVPLLIEAALPGQAIYWSQTSDDNIPNIFEFVAVKCEDTGYYIVDKEKKSEPFEPALSYPTRCEGKGWGPIPYKNEQTMLTDSIGFVIAARNQDWKLVNKYLKKEVDLDMRDDLGRAAIHYAISHRHGDFVRFLIGQAVDITGVTDDGGFTPLHLACAHDDLRLIIVLLGIHLRNGESDKTIHRLSKAHQENAVHISAVVGNIDAIRRLIQAGVDCTSKNKEGFTPSQLAQAYGKFDVVNVIREQIEMERTLLFAEQQKLEAEYRTEWASKYSDQFNRTHGGASKRVRFMGRDDDSHLLNPNNRYTYDAATGMVTGYHSNQEKEVKQANWQEDEIASNRIEEAKYWSGLSKRKSQRQYQMEMEDEPYVRDEFSDGDIEFIAEPGQPAPSFFRGPDVHHSSRSKWEHNNSDEQSSDTEWGEDGDENDFGGYEAPPKRKNGLSGQDVWQGFDEDECEDVEGDYYKNANWGGYNSYGAPVFNSPVDAPIATATATKSISAAAPAPEFDEYFARYEREMAAEAKLRDVGQNASNASNASNAQENYDWGEGEFDEEDMR